jgi:hypothetical protein
MIKSDEKMRPKKVVSSFVSSFAVQGGIFRHMTNKIGQSVPKENPVFSGDIENTGLKLSAPDGSRTHTLCLQTAKISAF